MTEDEGIPQDDRVNVKRVIILRHCQNKAIISLIINVMNQNSFPSRLVAGIIVALFFGVALYLRVALPYDQVFVGDWIKFTGVDAYYFMRIVDNLVHNFPHLNSFDPYLLYPGGGGPGPLNFFVYFLAGITWLVGLGSPTQHTVDIVGVYFPAILGALTVIPVYFIGKTLFNRWAGILAAGLIAVLPGEFLGRSILGFTDYHVAEVLFTTVAMLFLILAVKSATQSGMTFKHVKSRGWRTIVKPFIYSLLAGIFLGIYFLTWMGALLFVLIIFVYLVLQFIIDHLRGRATGYLCFVSTITFIVALLMFLPASPSLMSLASLFIVILVPIALTVLSSFMASRSIKPIFYPAAILGLGLVSLAIFHIVNPALLRAMIGSLGIFAWPTGTTVYEMEPLLFPGGNFSLTVAWANFTTSFFLCFVSLGILIYSVIKRGETDKTLFIIWSLVMLAATLSMRRFAYYFVINVALLAGYLSWLILEFSGFREKAAKPAEALIEAKKKDRQKKRQRDSSRSRANPVNMALGMIVVIFLVFYPNIGPLPGGAEPPINAAKYAPFAPSDAWYESLSWLKDNTPDPFDNPDFYYDLYEPPLPGESYNYPQTAYGVTAWWDYGYWITRIGHRIPKSNPGTGHRGEAIVFAAQDEAAAYYATSGVDLCGADHVVLSKFIASSTGYITEIRLNCFDSGNVKIAICSDCNGEPGTLLNKVDTSTAVVSGWNTITLPATSVTSDTAYWLAFNSDVPIVGYSGLTGTCRYKAASYSDFTFPSSAGIGFFSSQFLLLQAGYGTASLPPSLTAPMVTNASGASNTTASSARLNGNLTSTGSTATTAHVCWDDSDGGTNLDNWANDINLGIKDTGAFYTDISGLTSGRTYYYRCYATNAGGIAWATNSASFIAQTGQIQKLIGADDIAGLGLCGADHVVLSKFTASSTGYITEIRLNCFDSGNVKIAIYSDWNGEPGTLLNKVDTSTAVVSGWNTITLPATSVTSDTAYWLAFNSDAPVVGYSGQTGISRSKAASYSDFTFPSYAGIGFFSSQFLLLQAGYGTASLPPSLTAPMVTNASGASNTTASSARLNGNLTSTGSTATTVHVCWGDSDGGTNLDNWANDINLGIKDTGAFYTDISGLTSGRTYYYRCYATNAGGIAWAANSASFIAQTGQIQKLIGADVMQERGSNYVIVDYSTAMLIGGKFQAVATLSGNSPEKFFDVYYQPREDKLEPVILLYPEYYRSLLIRLYNFDGKQVVPRSSIVISFEERVSREGQPYKEITSAKSLPSYEEAEAYISSQESGNYRIVNDDPFVSPVPLQALEHYKLVYSSNGSKTMPSGGLIPEVKIFEYIGD